MLELKAVTKIFDKTRVTLDRISFQIGKGEFLFLIGPNQAGKTTLLNLITLEEVPTSGEIIFDQFSSRTIRKRQMPLWRRRIGRIYPDFRLINDMNIFNNIALSLRVGGGKENKIKNRVHQVMAMVGLSGKEGWFPNQLSAGEKQKAACARAIAKDPLLLLADELILNLDEKGREEILKLLKQINLLGTAVLLATHDFSMGMNHQVRIIKMDQGKLV